ncbi:RHS repeat-associated core domain-containing protein [Pseudomonas putida]|uniref:RHS repeat-associated core domain-containing protein n=1 Tax=Pseudomonas putida TaxID=303 RepID=UPI003905F6FF
MQQNPKQHLFYNLGHLSAAIGIDQSITLFSASGTPLAERSAETLITAVNAQNSITNSLHRDRIQSLTYSAYGHSHLDHTLGYTGQRCDRFTNLYLLGNGYRAYSPYLMRFHSPDNLSPFGKGGRNAYAYCEGDPTNNFDPSGHMLRKIINFFNREPVTPTPSTTVHSQYYSKAVAITESTPPLAEFPQWFNSPHIQEKHLKKVVKLGDLADRLETWKPNPDLNYMLNDQQQWYLAFDQYYTALTEVVKMIKKNYIPRESKIEISPLPSLSSLKREGITQVKKPPSDIRQRP